MINRFRNKRLLKETNYGREGGWLIEIKDLKIAEFNKPKFEDMFWFSYELKIFETAFSEELKDSFFWDRDDIKYLSKALNEYALRSPIVNVIEEEGGFKVVVRSLYIEI